MNRPNFKTIILLGLALVLTTSIAIASALWSLREDALNEAQRNVRNISKVLAQQTMHSSQAIELVLDELVSEVRRRNLNELSVFEDSLKEKYIFEFLVDRLNRLPQADVATFTDSHGKVLAITRDWPAPDVNLSDRDYFKFFSQNNSRDLFISEPVQNKVTNTWTVYFSKRLETEDGEFLGVVLIGVRPEFFIPAFDVISSIAGQSMMLLRADGTILLRYPNSVVQTGTKLVDDTEWFSIVNSGGGSYRSAGLLNDRARIVAVQPTLNYNLIVNVAMLEAEALTTWRERATLVASISAIAEIILLLLLQAVRHLFVSQHKSEKSILEKSSELAVANIKLEKSLEDYTFLAHHDPLCALYNRSYFISYLNASLSRTYDRISALILIDLDLFKEVNDTFGHHAGDMVLREVGRRLAKCTKEQDIIARLGGDEFGILVRTGEDVEAILERTTLITSALRRPFAFDGNSLSVGASIGIQCIAPEEKLVEKIMKNADLALYQAKLDGRNCVRIFEPRMEIAYRFRRDLATDLIKAIEDNAIRIVYQPIVRALDFKISSMEALIRWDHPIKGPISPKLIVDISEEVGLIHLLGEYVLRRALLDARSWHSGVNLSVNVSALQLNSEKFPDLVRRAIADTKLRPQRIMLEITETALIKDYQQAKRNLETLKSIGVDVALDDFGTGYSSLSYLHSLSFQNIKIDKSFIDGIDSNRSSIIVESIVNIAHCANSTTTAEGVENLKQMLVLKSAGVTNFQGFLFGKPMPLEAWELENEVFLFPKVEIGSKAKHVA